MTPCPPPNVLPQRRPCLVPLLACALALPLLAGCAHRGGAVEPQAAGAQQRLDALTQPHMGLPLPPLDDDAANSRSARHKRIEQLLAAPLAADAALELALLQHAGLRARRLQARISDADLAQAATLPNPGLSLGRVRGSGAELELSIGLHWNLARWLARSWLLAGEQERVAAEQHALAADILRHVFDLRRAWVQAVAAEQILTYRRQVRDAAEAAAELARRMQQVGNFSRLQRLREHAFYADAALDLARAEQARAAARERLIRLLGLDGALAEQLRLPERLPDLPAALRSWPELERSLPTSRLDVQAAQRGVEQQAALLGQLRATRLLDPLELGLEHSHKRPDAHVERGVELRLELPLFDRGEARLARAQALHQQAQARAEAAATDARSQLREAYALYLNAWDIARHQRYERVPLAQRTSEEQLLRYNGMLIGVFELLADARSQIATVMAAIEAERDFWLTSIDLDQALIGPPPSSAALPLPAAGTPAAAGGDRH